MKKIFTMMAIFAVTATVVLTACSKKGEPTQRDFTKLSTELLEKSIGANLTDITDQLIKDGFSEADENLYYKESVNGDFYYEIKSDAGVVTSITGSFSDYNHTKIETYKSLYIQECKKQLSKNFTHFKGVKENLKEFLDFDCEKNMTEFENIVEKSSFNSHNYTNYYVNNDMDLEILYEDRYDPFNQTLILIKAEKKNQESLIYQRASSSCD